MTDQPTVLIVPMGNRTVTADWTPSWAVMAPGMTTHDHVTGLAAHVVAGSLSLDRAATELCAVNEDLSRETARGLIASTQRFLAEEPSGCRPTRGT